jgi:hypothetical protein
MKYAGDLRYSAPEFWYSGTKLPTISGKVVFDVRKASDLYLLGSMGFFFVTGEALTPAMRARMRPEHNGTNWAGKFQDVLPYLRDAFGKAMMAFDAEIPRDDKGHISSAAAELRTAIVELCDPDPLLRGRRDNVVSGLPQYSLQRYVSLFNKLTTQFSIEERQMS